MYTKDKSVRITFRCDDKLADWVVSQSELIGLTPSAYVRQQLFGLMATQVKLTQAINNSITSTIASTAKAANDEHNTSN